MIAALRDLYGAISAQQRRRLLALFALMLLAAGAESLLVAATVRFLAVLTDASKLARELNVRGAGEARLVRAAIEFAVAAVVTGSVRIAVVWLTQRFSFNLGHELSVEVQRKILRQPYEYHLQHNSSEFVASLEKVQILVSAIVLQLLQGAAGMLIGLFIVAYLMTVNPLATIAAVTGFAGLYLILGRLQRRRLRRNSARLERVYDDRVKLLQESVGAIRDILLHGSVAPYVEKFRAVDARFVDAAISTSAAAALPRYVIEAAGMVIFAGIVVGLSQTHDIMTAVPLLGGLAIAAQRLLPLAQQIYQAWVRVTGESSIIRQVTDLVRLPEHEFPSAAETLPFHRSIKLDNVSFSYPGRTTPAIDQVSLHIRKGERVALVGPNGSGKSTLADLVLGLLEPGSGQILIDGAPLDHSTRPSWQKHIAHMPQAVFLADSSIAENIALGVPRPEIDHALVEQAAKVAKLTDFVASLPDGLETEVGERGFRLSGGQRQRIGLARALYRNPSVLVLDEPSSALDVTTEEALVETLEQLRDRGSTVIIISHRAAVIEDCDRTFELADGRLVEIDAATEKSGTRRTPA